jgi:catechol-2,3-dioxygenase
MAPPIKLAHIVLQTNRIDEMQGWYCKVLSARVIHDASPFISFISYDDEHHRIAFLNPGPLTEREPGVGGPVAAGRESGLHHVAFTFASLKDLLENYRRLSAIGIRPYWCVNHGPTTSMYYQDPDKNQVELQIDNFATAEQGRAYMESPSFRKNPVGVEFDPEVLDARFRSGESIKELTLIE